MGEVPPLEVNKAIEVIESADGARMEVRLTSPADAERICELYETLSIGDRLRGSVPTWPPADLRSRVRHRSEASGATPTSISGCVEVEPDSADAFAQVLALIGQAAVRDGQR